MFVDKLREKMTNYYVVFVGRKCGVCNSWIKCQRRVILFKGCYTKPTLPETELCHHRCYIHQDGRHLMDLSSARKSSLTLNCGHEDQKQIEKYSSAMYICFIT